MTPQETKSLDCPVDMASIPALLDFVEERAIAAGGGEHEALHLRLAAEEIATNIVKNAVSGAGGGVRLISRSAEAGQIELEFRDQGPAFNPLARPLPDTSAGWEQRRPGGLGILLAREFCDQMEYRREGPENVLVLRKTYA